MDFHFPENHQRGRFISQTDDMTVNLIPGFLAYTAGVAGNIHFSLIYKHIYLFQLLLCLHQVFLGTQIFYLLHQVGHQTPQAVPCKMCLVFIPYIWFVLQQNSLDSALPPVPPPQPVDANQYYYQPQQPVSVYQPEPVQYTQQALPLPPPQPRVNLPYQPQPVQAVNHYQTGGFLPSPHDNKAYQQQANPNDVDIYNKLVHLQEELRRLQEAEQLLSNALSNRYIELTQQENTQK